MDQEYFPLPGTPVEELDTPAIVVDLDVAEANIERLQSWANENGVSVRPHAKTHKSPYWAHKQIRAGAIGVCAAKVGEAEVLAAAGVPEVMIPNQVIGPRKIARLVSLARTTRMIVAVDHADNVRDLSKAAAGAGAELGVIIEINAGMNRCGVEPEDAPALAKVINDAPGLRFDGVMGYEGHTVAIRDFEERKTEALRAMDRLTNAAKAIRAAGIDVKIVSAAGTGTYNITGTVEDVTELQCGSYIFMDGDYLQVFNDFDPALSVLATVISRPAPDRGVIDMGMKSMSSDRGMPAVLGVAGATVTGLSEEHGKLSLEGEAQKLRVGDRIHLRPMHGDTTINLHTHYFGVRRGRLEAVIPIPGRGRFR
ncbi:MAG: DSD1 family PLP-dependent enzyme [Dehalococcoidia bacterium]